MTESPPRNFRKIEVWKRAIELSVMVYRLTASFPAEERYGLVSQMRRAAVSIASNVAEGSGRGSDRVFRMFVGIAIGSNFELQTQLTIAGRVGLCAAEDLVEAEVLSAETARMLYGLRAKLSKSCRQAEERKRGELMSDGAVL